MAKPGHLAPTIYRNGRIFTKGEVGLNTQPIFDDSMYVAGGVIKAIGSQEEILDRYSDGAKVVDLEQKTVLPSFIDGHMHLNLLGSSLLRVPLETCHSLDDILSKIKEYALANPDVPRILCKNWMHSMTPNGVTASLIDTVDPQKRPIFIDTKDLHSTWCNSAAMEELGIGNDMPDPPGGKIQRGTDGRPNGLFSEAAVWAIIRPHIAKITSKQDREDAMVKALESYAQNGYTGVVDMAMDAPALDAILSVREQRPDLAMRIAIYWLIKPSSNDASRLEQVEKAIELNRMYNERTSPDLKVVGIKIVCDGIVDACTAFLSEAYSTLDNPTPFWPKADLEPVVKAADAAGLQIALHAIGDAAITMAIDTLEKYGTPGRRHRIEHLELASSEDAKRLGQLHLTASIQPVHADPAILRAWPRLLGEHRCGRAFAYREFVDSGTPVAMGTDSPTAPYAPLENVFVATTRRSAREPNYDSTFNQHFRLGVCESIVAYTKGAAMSVFNDDRVGTLQVGKLADFIVVDMNWDANDLLKAKILKTYFNGRNIWSAK